MTEDIKDIFDDAKEESLTHAERAVMRNELRLFMMQHPAIAPLRLRILDRVSGFFDAIEALPLMHARALVPSVLALVLVVGVGTSYAAENALPGDPLYAIKIHVNEPIQGALVGSGAAKAEWSTKLVERRLEEAEQLAAEGRLNPVARAQIQSNLAVTTADFNATVAEIAKTEGPEEVAQAQSDLEASLAGHQAVLAALASSTKDSSDIEPILASVVIHRDAVASSRSQAEALISSKGDGKIRAAAAQTQKEAQDAIEQVTQAISAAAQQGATTSAVRASAEDAQKNIHDGEQKLENGDYGEAFKAFQAASRNAESAHVHLDAQLRLKDKINTDSSDDPTASTTDAATE